MYQVKHQAPESELQAITTKRSEPRSIDLNQDIRRSDTLYQFLTFFILYF